ncbi:MAG: OmpH family outer membrane protein [Bacteroidales bacterium]|nr:OmpH family outer membrane protein [Bacteroidales bacterium]
MTENLENKGKNPMSGLWIANIVLMFGLILLYVLHFNSRSESQSKEADQLLTSDPHAAPRIAFIDSDTLMLQYEMVSEMVNSFEASTIAKEATMRKRQNEFEQKVNDFQKRVQSGSISMEIAQITEQQLMTEQQELMSLRDELSDQLAKEEFDMNVQLLDIVSLFLEDYNRTRQYDLIFNFKKGTNLFVANQVYDITPEVIELLNQEYRLKSQKK